MCNRRSANLNILNQLLCDFDCEEDPMILIQALAMMSRWNQRKTVPKTPCIGLIPASLSLSSVDSTVRISPIWEVCKPVCEKEHGGRFTARVGLFF